MSSFARSRLAAALLGVAVAVPAGSPATPAAPPQARTPDLATASSSRWIVQLPQPSVATYRGHRPGLPATSPAQTGRRIDFASPVVQAYLGWLQTRQDDMRTRLASAVPAAVIERSYKVVLNALAVRMDARAAAVVRALPGVRAVTPDLPFRRQMYATPAQISAPAVWQRLGGVRNAGEGIRVGIIDSGIYVTKDASGRYTGNACFADSGYRAPAGFPKGDTRFTNNKVIVARTYFRPNDPAIPADATAAPGVSGNGHGSHVAGTVACNAGTRVTYLGTPVTLSGIAPRAYLMNYRVFYDSRSPEDFQNGNAYTVELVAAMEDAVADGADVVSNSWGSSYQNTRAWPDPMVRAAEAATDAGVVMVFAQGNSGPAEATGNSPANSPKVIAVGASTKRATVATGDISVPGGPPALQRMAVGGARFGPDPASFPAAPYVPAETVALDQSSLGCSLEQDLSPFPPGSLAGSIALIARGTCAFSEKVYNAQRGGAVAAIIYNNASGGDNLQAIPSGPHAADITIPSWFMRRSQGLAMRDHRTADSTAQASFARNRRMVGNVGDVLAGFSSFGPTEDGIVKPDVVAPGVDVLSAAFGAGGYPDEYRGFGAISGTSMATPHVAGAAALLRQAHPEWTPAQVKSALMSTATETIFRDSARTERVGVLGRGAGRIDLSRALNPGLTFDRPSLSAGNVRPGGRIPTFRVTATDVGGAGGTWTLSVRDTPGMRLVLNKSRLVLRPGSSGSFTVAAFYGATPGNREASIVLTGPTFAHIPVHLRVTPAAAKDVLLVDDDGSAADPTLVDVAPQFETALAQAGLTFDTVDAWEQGLPPLESLNTYRLIVLFTGNNASFDTSGFSVGDQDVLAQWLNGGGRLLATGQNLAEATDSSSFSSARIGRSRLYHGYLGVLQADPDVFERPVPPGPTAEGRGVMSGLRVDLSPSVDGLPNQSSIEAMAPMFDNDSYQAPETVRPLFAPLGAEAPGGSALAFARSSEPSISEPRRKFEYRSVAFGFGLEGVGGAGGTASRATVLARAARWLLDDVRVTFTGVAGERTKTLRVSVASSGRAAISRIRWDFGDGSPVVTAGPAVTHAFVPGTYTVRVEATDALGHRAVAARRISVR